MLYSVVIIYSLVNYGWQFPTIGKSAATRQLHAFKPIYIYIYQMDHITRNIFTLWFY